MEGLILTDNIWDGPQGSALEYWIKSDQGVIKAIFDNESYIFFVEQRSEFTLTPGVTRKPLNLKNFTGQNMDGLYFKSFKNLQVSKDQLHNSGIRTFESDIRPNERFLMERFINGSCKISGEFTNKGNYSEVRNPKITKSDYIPKLSIFSLDIETSMGNDLYSIAYHFLCPQTKREIKKVAIIGDLKNTQDVFFFKDEQGLLNSLIFDLKKLDPDIICGWHVVGFDLDFIIRKCIQYNIKYNFGRGDLEVRLGERKSGGLYIDIPGRLVFDGPILLKMAYFNFENYKLETVASSVLGYGKDISDAGLSKVEEITRRFHEDKMGLAKYNLLDCTLVLEIFEKLSIVDHYLKRILYSGMLFDRISSSVKAFDHLYLPMLHRRGLVAGNTIDIDKDTSSLGGFVMPGRKGLHDNVIVLDFKSLYPSIILTFKIDPLSRLKGNEQPILLPSGVSFSKTEHILPEVIKNLLNLRKIAKEKKDANLSQAVKILMNSFYGVMGSGGCRFYHADLAQSITETGQWIIKEAINFLGQNGFDVIYGDTDSLFIKLNMLQAAGVEKTGANLVAKINGHLEELIKKKFDIESYLEIQFDKSFSKLFIPESRTSEDGVKKRYVGLIKKNNVEELYFSGMEFVRSDWTKLAKKFQFDIMKKFFNGENLSEFIKDFVADLKSGLYDEDLIYRKRLSKRAREYTKNVPPHVKAALLEIEKFGDENIRSIAYYYSRKGPIPVSFGISEIDYQHYTDKQLAPIANDVLKFQNTSFDDIISGAQLTLF